MKKKPPFNQNAAIRGALRRLFARSPIVREVMSKVRREVPKYNKDGSRAKKDAVQYLCAVCGTWTKSTAIAVDHVVPVVAVEDGFIDWNEFVARLFCGPENLQVICDPCHNEKTRVERIARLVKQYSRELDAIEDSINNPPRDSRFIKKHLAKYIAKKKTKGLEEIVQRARELKIRVDKLN